MLIHLDANFVQKWQKCQVCVIYENLDCLVKCTIRYYREELEYLCKETI